MISLMKGALGTSTSYQDKVMYMTSLALNVSIGSEKNLKNRTVVDTIIKLVSSSETRYVGLQLLEMTLQQNSQMIYNRGQCVVISFEVIKDPQATNVEKGQACRILALIFPYMVNDASLDWAKEESTKAIVPFLLKKINENVEWAEEAGLCIKVCLQNFPNDMSFYQNELFQMVLHRTSVCISTKSFEVFAECFSELPNCIKENNAAFKDRWKQLYLQTLKTIESLLVASLYNETYSLAGIDAEEFVFKEDDNPDFITNFMKRVRRFVNLCKCLSKLLSVKTRHAVKPAVSYTLKVLFQLFTVCRKDSVISSQQEALFTFIAQMRLGGLAILESLILNCHLLKYTSLMSEVIRAAIDSSVSAVSSELVSELRLATWKVLSLWLDGHGPLVCKEIIDAELSNTHIIEELLEDTALGLRESLQDKAAQENNKLKKDLSNVSFTKRKNQEEVCIAALDSLDSLFSAGIRSFSKGLFKQICNHILKLCEEIDFSRDLIPFPYNNECCREKLYKVLFVIIEVLKPEDHRILQAAVKILQHMGQDPSYKVKKLSNRALSKCKLQFHPNRQFAILVEAQKKQQVVSDDNINSVWVSEEYSHNLTVQNIREESDNVNIKIDQSFTTENEVEVHSVECMDVETHYSEQIAENQCNGDDILIQSSSQCQDDVDDDDEEEEDEEEEVEEEEERIADEEINQEEPSQETYIPTTRKMQTPPPMQIINTETVLSTVEPEYVELTPCIKVEENTINTNTRDKCVNGERKGVNVECIPSSSTQKTNENGIFGIDDDDLDEENEEEEEEENSENLPLEKRAENYDQPPSKKQKVETKDDTEMDARRENAKSPTLEEMKADFEQLLPTLEDVKSGKFQLSSP